MPAFSCAVGVERSGWAGLAEFDPEFIQPTAQGKRMSALQPPAHDNNRQAVERWHVGKEIPLAMIAAVFLQTMGGVWFAATYVSKIDTLTALMSEFKSQQYTQNDARKDHQHIADRQADAIRRIEKLEGSVYGDRDRDMSRIPR